MTRDGLAARLRFKLEQRTLNFRACLPFSAALLRCACAANRAGHQIAYRQ